ncbi:hypothetical protein T492DRAFT_1065719 [Pavlovales sp. CCMP2436]|nr:hypothetical protein T492DRAFT_1065719 [Pavlovales sp. CCMP2436]
MRRALEAAGVKTTGEAVEAAFAKADGDGDGKISFAEYCELHTLGQAGSGQRATAPASWLSFDAQRIAALRLPAQKLAELCACFARYDKDGLGAISIAELTLALKSTGVQAVMASKVFAQADRDKSGFISFSEFCELHALIAPTSGSAYQELSEGALRRVFDAYDLERTGSLPAAMLPHALRGLGVSADAKQARAALAWLGLPPPDTLNVYSFAEFREVASGLHLQAAKRGLRSGSAGRGAPPRRSPPRGSRGGASEVRSMLDQAENEKSSLRAALAREQAFRRQAQSELSVALDRIALLERLVPVALEGAAAARAGGGTGDGSFASLESRALALAAELRAKAGPTALAAHASRGGVMRGPSGGGPSSTAADVYRKQAAADKRELDGLRRELELARDAIADECASRTEAEQRIHEANRRAAGSQLRAFELEEELGSLQAEQAELSDRQALLEAEVVQLAAMADASALIGHRPSGGGSRPLGRQGSDLTLGSFAIRSSRPTTPRSFSGTLERHAKAPPSASRASVARQGDRRSSFGLPTATLRELRLAFDKYDSDRSGSITRAELTGALGAAGVADPQAVAAAFTKADSDGDGKISFGEFCDLHIRQKLKASPPAAGLVGRSASTDAERAAAARAIQEQLRASTQHRTRGSRIAHFSRPAERSSALHLSTFSHRDSFRGNEPGSLPPSLRSSLRDTHTLGSRSAGLALPAHEPKSRSPRRSLSPRRELTLRLYNIANEMAQEMATQDKLQDKLRESVGGRRR